MVNPSDWWMKSEKIEVRFPARDADTQCDAERRFLLVLAAQPFVYEVFCDLNPTHELWMRVGLKVGFLYFMVRCQSSCSKTRVYG